MVGIAGAGAFAIYLRRKGQHDLSSFLVQKPARIQPKHVDAQSIPELVQNIKDNISKIRSIIFNNLEPTRYKYYDDDDNETPIQRDSVTCDRAYKDCCE